MAMYKCLSCGAIYADKNADGSLYFHACPPTLTQTPAVVDKLTGAITTPAVVAPTANPRNENIRADLVYIEGKAKLVSRDPNDVTREIVKDADTFIISEGAGRAPYDPATQTVGAAQIGPTIPGK